MEYIIKSNSYRLLKEQINFLTKDIDKENITYFDLSIDSLKDILSDSSYSSLFDDKKAIIVYNASIFGTKYEYKDDLALLERYLNNPNENTILIFIADSVSLKKKCVKIIKDNNHLIELNITDKEVSNYVKEYLSNNNFKIESNALELLINNLNNNYDYILNELDKVIIMKKDYVINIDDIKNYTISIEKDNIFDFVDLIIKKDNKIFKYLNKFIENKEEVSILFSNLATQYRLIYCVRNLVKNGYSESDIAKKFDIHPYRVKLARDKGYDYSNSELKDKLLKIGELDGKIKSGLIDKYVALKLFLLDL